MFVLASDLGSGGCKTVILNQQAQVVSSASAEYPTFYPQPGWVEQNPDDWYQAFAQTCRQAIAQSGVPASQIARVGLVAVTHNTVLLDKNDHPLRHSILTFDKRSHQQCRQILARWGDQAQHKTLNGVSPLWTWPQLLWIKQREPDIWQATHRLLFQKTD